MALGTRSLRGLLLPSLLAVVPAMALARGAAKAGEEAAVAGVKPGIVDGATARRLVAGGVKVVDVRTPAEFASGHVPGAVNIPYDEMAKRHAEIGPPSTPVLLYCRSGRRSEVASRALRERGFSAIYDLQAYERWVRSEPRDQQ
jgi:rhodanese-related sulfurtransferase